MSKYNKGNKFVLEIESVLMDDKYNSRGDYSIYQIKDLPFVFDDGQLDCLKKQHEGYEKAYQDGYEDGHHVGYDAGFDDALDSMKGIIEAKISVRKAEGRRLDL